MKIAIGSDHAGFALKGAVIRHLEKEGHRVADYGTHSSESTDYPDYAHAVAEALRDPSFDFGILICGSGNGVCMTANKHPHIRAALAWNRDLAALARQHNNANVLCLSARFIDTSLALELVDVFLSTSFEGGRHARRVEKIPLD